MRMRTRQKVFCEVFTHTDLSPQTQTTPAPLLNMSDLLVEKAKLAEQAERYEDMAEVRRIFECVSLCRLHV